MTNKHILYMFLFIVASAIIIFGGMVVWRLFFHETLKNVVLANDVQITSEWKEVGTPNELKVDKKYNYISLQIAPPLEAYTVGGGSTKSGIKIPSGEVVNPEIRIIDVEGKEYPLFYSGHRGGGAFEFVNYEFEGNLPIDKKYQKVKLRSDVPLTIKKIFWSGFDQSDMK